LPRNHVGRAHQPGYHAKVTDIEDVIHAFVDFPQEDPMLAHRLPWKPYAV
jgi:hypothetical protein